MTDVAIIEDHQQFRESISYIFSTTEGFNCCGAYSNVEDALEKLTAAHVILLDINLPGISGVEGIIPLKIKFPSVKIIMLTVFEDDLNLFRAILNGADGYLLKKTPPIRLIQAVEDAASGGSPLSPAMAKRTLDIFRKFAPVKNDSYQLTEREKDVLSLLVDGLSTEEISGKLFISIQTVRNHIRHIYEKLHVHSKSHAVSKAIRQGLI